MFAQLWFRGVSEGGVMWDGILGFDLRAPHMLSVLSLNFIISASVILRQDFTVFRLVRFVYTFA